MEHYLEIRHYGLILSVMGQTRTYPMPVNFSSQWSRSFCIRASVIICTSSERLATRALLLLNFGSAGKSGRPRMTSAKSLNCVIEFNQRPYPRSRSIYDIPGRTCLSFPAPIMMNPSLHGKTWYGTMEGCAVPCLPPSSPAMR